MSADATRESSGTVAHGNPSHSYLRLHSVDVFVRNYERSLRFFTEQLGFELAFDACLQYGQRLIGVAPPDGTAVLTLIQPEPNSPEHKLIGRATRVMFVTEDIARTYSEWMARGVRFRHTPRLRRVKYQKDRLPGGGPGDPSVAHGDQAPVWGQVFTRFEDLDGNVFSLVSFDEVSKAVEAQRRALQEKRDAERRLEYELDIARQVQARLLPNAQPPCTTMEYAGKCVQARHVGGDYFDFLSLGEDRLALIVGDIAGKGIAAALLMANLQANLRSQSMSAVANPQGFLRSVNQLFHVNTGASAYATLFFADYCTTERQLRYVNCGHLPGLVLRSNGKVRWLPSTCTVLGLFDEWECSVDECTLAPGDTLLIYTDGVTETFNQSGQDFGEDGLLASARAHNHLPPQQMIDAILSDVHAFGTDEQRDDLTLVVARCTN